MEIDVMDKEVETFYVYVHRYASGDNKGKVFYVGKGMKNRKNIKYGRSTHWRRISSKYGFIPEVVKRFNTNECALTYERIMIKLIGRDNLCNLTDGGEGGSNPSEETRRKMSAAKIGKKQRPEHAEKSRLAKKGKSQSKYAISKLIESKSKPVISSNGEIFSSSCEAARVLSSRMGKYISQGNISMCANGHRNNAYNLSWSYDINKKPDFKPTRYQRRKVQNTTNGITFNSVQDAVKYVKNKNGSASNQCISYAARMNTTAYGYKWKYIDEDKTEMVSAGSP